MKKYFYYILPIISLFIASCDSTIDEIHVDSPSEATASTLELEGQSNVVPTDSNLTQQAIALKWTESSFGNETIPITYTLEVDTNNNFSNSKKIALGTKILSKSATYKEVNDWGLLFTKDVDNIEPLDLFVRVAASVYTLSTSPIAPPDSVYSNSITLNVTPFLNEPAIVYVPGDYLVNSWNPQNSPVLYSEMRNGIYEGYIYLDSLFKITPEPNWNLAYGDAGAGKVSSSGGNITSTPGFYWMEFNLNDLSYKLTPITFSVIGSIKGDWGVEYPLTYDQTNNVLSITDNFSSGEFKFKRNGDWFFGVDAQGNLVPNSTNGVQNIPMSLSGNVTITLDLWNYLEPKYNIQ